MFQARKPRLVWSRVVPVAMRKKKMEKTDPPPPCIRYVSVCTVQSNTINKQNPKVSARVLSVGSQRDRFVTNLDTDVVAGLIVDIVHLPAVKDGGVRPTTHPPLRLVNLPVCHDTKRKKR